MKKILDRLLARQGRLMADLAESEATKKSGARSVAEIGDPEAELIAIEASNALLAAGDLSAAESALLPFQRKATSVRTLTTLSRIRSASGSFDEAHELLEQAYRLDPGDIKVPYFTAELLDLQGKHRDAITYRRRVAFGSDQPDAGALVELIRTIAKGATIDKGVSVREVQMALESFLASPNRTLQQTLDVCQVLYGIESMQDEAARLYEAADPCPVDKLDFDASWQNLLSWCTSEGKELRALGDGGRPGKRPMVARVTDALVIEDFQFTPIVSNNRVVLSGAANRNQRLKSLDEESPLLMTTSASCRLRLPKERQTVTEPCILIGGVGSYYYDLIEHIGSLATVEQLDLQASRRLVLNAKPSPFQLELLALLGYDSSRLLCLPRDGGARFADLFVPSNLAHGGRWIDPTLVDWYRRRLLPAGSGGGTRKLYLSRRFTGSRRVENEPDVESLMKVLGFEIVVPERLSVKDQIALFADAACVVAPNGAALTNMIFAPPGTKVVVACNRVLTQARGSLYFDALAQACGHRFQILECAPARLTTGSRLIDADLRVDVDALAALVV